MANVLNRTTKQYIRSANTPAYPIVDWIINPDLSAITGFDRKYWIITGDIVSLMDQVARGTVDAAELESQRDNIANQLDGTEDILRAQTLVIMDEINILRSQHALPDRTIAQLKTAVRNKLGS